MSRDATQNGPKETNKVIFNQQGKSAQIYHFDAGFLAGTVPGCDLRLGGSDLPSLLFQVVIHQGRYLIRKLTPLSGLTLNGNPFEVSEITSTDIVRIASWEFAFNFTKAAASLRLDPPHALPDPKTKKKRRRPALDNRKTMLHWLVKKVRKRNLVLKQKQAVLDELDQNLTQREQAIASRENQVLAEKSFLEEQLRQFAERNHREKDEIESLKHGLLQQKKELDRDKSQLTNFQDLRDSDLARLARFQDMLDRKFQHLKDRAREVDRRGEELQRASRELEEQASLISTLHEKLERDRLQAEQAQIEKTTQIEDARAKSRDLENQLSQLVQMKVALEHSRDQLRSRESTLEARQLELETLQSSFTLKQNLFENQTQEFLLGKQAFEVTRAGILNQAGLLEQKQFSLENQEAELAQLGRKISDQQACLDVREKEILLREQSLLDQQQNLQETLNQHQTREKEVDTTGKSLAQMQEALRKRFEEIESLRGELASRDTKLAQELQNLQARAEEMETENAQLTSQLNTARMDLEKREEELKILHQDLERQFQSLQDEKRGHAEIKNEIFEALHRLDQEKKQFQETQETHQIQADQKKESVFELIARMETLASSLGIHRKEAEDSLSRILGARDMVREHLSGFYSYATDIRQELEDLRKEANKEEQSSLELESKLTRSREDHRLAVASFRQQLIEWQQKIADIKFSLQAGESELERKRSAFNQQASVFKQQSEQLEKKEAKLRKDVEMVESNKAVIQRHLEDMQVWYRQKIREISLGAPIETEIHYHTPIPQALPQLPADDLEQADHGLGRQMLELGLIDNDSLLALLGDARKNHKTLRQALLNGGYLTFYQLALIEAGNLTSLMIHRFRVIDKLRSSSKECLYRVFDPSHNQECLLRILSETELMDPVHPDEFRQRFITACAIHHENVATTYEFAEIQGKPAVLTEYIEGTQISECPEALDDFGAWLRLIWQAVSGLASIHGCGLSFGPITESSIILHSSGTLKWTGAGQPSWLVQQDSTHHPSLRDDVVNLARISINWIDMANASTVSLGAPQEFIQWLQGIIQGDISTNLNEWLIRVGALLEEFDCDDRTYLAQVKKLSNTSTGSTLRLSA